ncbi:hypothetical protein GDO81_026104 [Engystomops pustulosus]|uniref:Taste receptor type 2 n=1 Tax=Engystomops pustulosus TaxID=76066 RepID=A0AAV6YZS7_ENGPU|nr:hypothetical protein GDO81_026104 [Engystomops pustulosus]
METQCLIFTAFSLLFHPIGLLINGFIVIVNLNDMRQRRSLKPVDKVLLCLGFCRFCLQSLLIFETITYHYFFNGSPFNICYVVYISIQKSLDYCNLWFTAWLCLIYCVKIASCKLQIFMFFQLRIPQMVIPAILGSTFVSGFCGCLVAQSFMGKNSSFSERSRRTDVDLDIVISAATFGNFLPFIIVTLCSIHLVHTLIRHIHNLKKISRNVIGLRMEVHLSAIRSVLLYFAVSSLKLISTIMIWIVPAYSFWYTVCVLFFMLYPTFHSTCILLGNSKLKTAGCKVVTWVRKCAE